MNNRVLLAALVYCATALPVSAALTLGAKAPDFTARASLAGKEFTFFLKDALRKGPVVVYFYPAAYTGGCNVQAHTFAVNIDKFSAAGATVVGVSLDRIATLNEFSADPEYCAGKLPVASDANGRIAQSYELTVQDARPGMKDTRGMEIAHGFAERTTFIVTPDGKIAATVGGVSPKENVEKALEVVQRLERPTPAASRTARADDPMSGRWEINLEKSVYEPGPLPKSAVRVHELEGDTIKVTLDIVPVSGRSRHAEFARKLDGKEYPDSDDPHADTISWKRIDERTLEFTQKTSGKTTESGRLQASEDGRQLTLSWKGRNAKGEEFNNFAVFDKR